MDFPITLEGKDPLFKTIWVITEGLLALQKGSTSKNIPLSTIKSLKYTPPTSFSRGRILLEDGAIPFGAVRVTGGVSLAAADSLGIDFKKEDLEIAESIRDYINEYITTPHNVPQPSPASFVDELVKLKALLDAGVLTQDEFETAKKKLLG